MIARHFHLAEAEARAKPVSAATGMDQPETGPQPARDPVAPPAPRWPERPEGGVMADLPWYSEQLTIMGRWSPQITPFKPRDRSMDGRKINLRRVRQLEPHEAHLSLGALRALEDDRETAAAELAESARMLGPRDLVATGLE